MYSTLAEVKRTCRLVASTETDYRTYNEQYKSAHRDKPFEFVIEWEAISIYSNELWYVITYHAGNKIELYKLR